MSLLPKPRTSKSTHPPIILLTGASGAGKSTVADRLLTRKTLALVKFVTCTTRPKRTGERHGKDYWFLSRQEFEQKIARHVFYEWAEVYGNYYGSSKEEMERRLKGKKAILIVIDVQGARTIKQVHPEALSIFIDADTAELKQRLIERNADINDLKRRLATIAKEKRYIKEADVVIVNHNGSLAQSVSTIAKAISQAYSRT